MFLQRDGILKAEKDYYKTEIGNKAEKMLKPEITFSKFNDSLSVRSLFQANQNYNYYVNEKLNSIDFVIPGFKQRFYPVENKFGENTDLEHEIIFDSFPDLVKFSKYNKDTASYEIQIDFEVKNLTATKQKSMKLEDSHFQDVVKTETKHIKDGFIIAERPQEIVNSYSFYLPASLRNNAFKTGKAFHYKRPWISGAFTGEKYYGDCEYKNGKMILSFNKDIINSLLFPVTVGPTFGNTSVGATTNSIVNSFVGLVAANPVEAGTVTDIQFYQSVSKTPSVNPDFSSSVYSFSGSTATKLGDFDEISPSNTTPQWRQLNTTDTINFTASDSLGIYVNAYRYGTDAYLEYYWDNVPNSIYYKNNMPYQYPLESPITFTNTLFTKMSIYFNYTTGGGGNIDELVQIALANIDARNLISSANIDQINMITF